MSINSHNLIVIPFVACVDYILRVDKEESSCCNIDIDLNRIGSKYFLTHKKCDIISKLFGSGNSVS